MKPFTIMLNSEDIEEVRNQARSLELPPHTYARSILLRGLRRDREELTGLAKPDAVEGGL